MTSNDTFAEFDCASVAVNVYVPVAVPLGIVKVHVKLPAAAVLVKQAVPPLQVTVTAELPANPVPLKATTVPTGPEVGRSTRFASTVKVVAAEFSFASVPVKVYCPFAVEGIVKSQLKLPTLLVVDEQAVPLTHVTFAFDEPAKPVPLKITDEPTMPEIGVAVRSGTTLNFTLAELKFASVALKVYEPAAIAGTLNVQLNAPDALVVPPHATPEGHPIEIDTLSANPDALKVIFVPTVPDDDETFRLGVSTNVAVALFLDASVAVNAYEPPRVYAGIV